MSLQQIALQVHESHPEPDIIKSKMEIDPTTQMDAGNININIHYETIHISFLLQSINRIL